MSQFQAELNEELLSAAEEGDLDNAKRLLQEGADINCQGNIDKHSPLHHAASEGHVDVVEYLLVRGANPNSRADADITPLHIAVLTNAVGVVRVLVQRGCDVNVKDRDYCTPLHIAARRGLEAILKLLIEAKADVNATDKGWKCTPLHETAKENYAQLADILIKSGAVVNVQDSTGVTPLHEAVHRNHIEVAQVLVDNGADVNIGENTFNSTPLQEATTDEMRQLLQAFAKGNLIVYDDRGIKAKQLDQVQNHSREDKLNSHSTFTDENQNSHSTSGTSEHVFPHSDELMKQNHYEVAQTEEEPNIVDNQTDLPSLVTNQVEHKSVSVNGSSKNETFDETKVKATPDIVIETDNSDIVSKSASLPRDIRNSRNNNGVLYKPSPTQKRKQNGTEPTLNKRHDIKAKSSENVSRVSKYSPILPRDVRDSTLNADPYYSPNIRLSRSSETINVKTSISNTNASSLNGTVPITVSVCDSLVNDKPESHEGTSAQTFSGDSGVSSKVHSNQSSVKHLEVNGRARSEDGDLDSGCDTLNEDHILDTRMSAASSMEDIEIKNDILDEDIDGELLQNGEVLDSDKIVKSLATLASETIETRNNNVLEIIDESQNKTETLSNGIDNSDTNNVIQVNNISRIEMTPCETDNLKMEAQPGHQNEQNVEFTSGNRVSSYPDNQETHVSVGNEQAAQNIPTFSSEDSSVDKASLPPYTHVNFKFLKEDTTFEATRNIVPEDEITIINHEQNLYTCDVVTSDSGKVLPVTAENDIQVEGNVDKTALNDLSMGTKDNAKAGDDIDTKLDKSIDEVDAEENYISEENSLKNTKISNIILDSNVSTQTGKDKTSSLKYVSFTSKDIKDVTNSSTGTDPNMNGELPKKKKPWEDDDTSSVKSVGRSLCWCCFSF